MHCVRFDHIPPVFQRYSPWLHIYNSLKQQKWASPCNKAAGSHMKPVHCYQTSDSESKDRNETLRRFLFQWNSLRKCALQVNIFLLCWKNNMIKVRQRRCHRLGQQMCDSLLCSVWERGRSGLSRTQQCPHHPFDGLGNCCVQSLTQKSFSNYLQTLCINPQPNWWLVELLFKWPADLNVFSQQMECVLFPPLSRMAVCGGTHGNEMSGVYMLRELKKQSVGQDGPVSLITVLSNPRAVESCRRYIDKDLNRCFTSHLLRQVEKIDKNIHKIFGT